MTDVKLLLNIRNGGHPWFLGWLAGNGTLVCLWTMIGVDFPTQGLATFEGVNFGYIDDAKMSASSVNAQTCFSPTNNGVYGVGVFSAAMRSRAA